MNQADSVPKINQGHLDRKAVVYLRQSSMAQVKHNQESQRLQYALTDTAKAYGFQRVEVIDWDLGMSASPARQCEPASNSSWPVLRWARSVSCSVVNCRDCHAPTRTGAT